MSGDGLTALRQDGAESRRGYILEIFLISLAALLIEIGYTRVISFKLFYYYTYLIIGLALLGIGCGSVLVAVSERLRRASLDAILLWGLLSGAASVGVGYLVVAVTEIATVDIWEYGTWTSVNNLARLVLVCLAIFASFISIGVMIASLFARRSEQIGRLYFVDLLGAGLACAVVVPLLNSIGAPATIMLAGLILAVAGLRMAARQRSRLAIGGAVLAVLLAAVVVLPDALPDQQVDELKDAHLSRYDIEFSEWSALFRVDVAELPDRRILHHDGLIGSVIFPYNGDPSSLSRFEQDPRSLPFSVAEDESDVMIIGAAGGHEILASLYYEADQIDAIELNPVTYDLVTDRYADYAGNLDDIEGVSYVKDDGRSFLARSDHQYDLIWYPAPDSYSASNAATSGAFVLSESYLYTSDTIVESLEHLRPDGIIAAQYGEFNYAEKPNRTSRYVSTARHALDEMGIDDPSRHIVVLTSKTDIGTTLSTILVKKTPFTAAEISRVVSQSGDLNEGTVEYAPGRPQDNPVSQLATLPDDQLDDFYDSYPYSIGPITDDGPFFWHFTPFGDVIRDFGEPLDPVDLEDSTGERVLLLLLGVAIALAALFLLLPFITIRKTWSDLPRKRVSALYFAALGLGFMFFEISLIQRLTLFLGYPTYSLTVTLASILIFTGIGALLSERFKHRPRQVMPVLLGVLAALAAFYQFGLSPLTDALLTLPLAGRVVVSFAVLAPLGLCLGTFMPIGLGVVAGLTSSPREYVAWGWAVNGFASVVGSVLTTILAMSYGFSTVLALALVVYLIAFLALRALLRPTQDDVVSVAEPERTEEEAEAPAMVPT